MKSFRSLSRLLALVCVLVVPGLLPAADLTVAAASDLKFALDELVTEFKAKHPADAIKVTYGSSGNFYAQLQNQAPFDLYLSADVMYPRKLAEAGLADTKDVFLYAVGRIVVWTPKGSPIDVKKLEVKSLLEPAAKKIAIANPQHAPYGVAAVAAMKSLGVYEQASPKLVLGENIAQTAQFVQSGAADLGIIALSLAIAPQMSDAGSYWEVPLTSYPKIEQGGVVLKSTKQPELARAFRDFILNQHGREVLKRFGFFLPE